MKKRSFLTLVCTVLCLTLIFCSCGKAPHENSEESGNRPDGGISAKKAQLSEVPDGYIGIYTAQDLQNVQKNMDANYILMNDLDLSGFDFKQLETSYHGIFEGNYYTIKNYSSDGALFDHVYDGTILNLTFDNALITRTADLAAFEKIGGIADSYDCSSDSTVTAIRNCHFNGKIVIQNDSKTNTNASIGGIVGEISHFSEAATVADCSFNGEIDLTNASVFAVGGIIGYSHAYIARCYSNGIIKSNNITGGVGGISGFQGGDMSNCYSRMDMQLDKCQAVGGIIGFSEGNAKWLYYNGSIKCNEFYSFTQEGGLESKEYSPAAIAGDIHEGNAIQYCYYLENGYPAVGDGTPYANVAALSEKDITNKASFKGFDFEKLWKIKRGEGPVLKNAQ